MLFSNSEKDFDKKAAKIIFEYPYRKTQKRFWDEMVPAMQELDPDPENVRMVFWFDN